MWNIAHTQCATLAAANNAMPPPNISAIKLMRIFSDGVASQESISSDAVAAGDGVTFAVSYNIPKFRIDYTVASSSAGVVLIEIEGGY